MSGTLRQSILRISRFILMRGLSLVFAVLVSVWLTIAVASRSGVLESEISGSKITGWFSGIMRTGTQAAPENFVPYQGTLKETVDLVIRGMTLNLGHTNTIYIYSSAGRSLDIRGMILDFLSRTMLLFGTVNLLLFVAGISLALLLYRNYGSFFDRLVVTLSPLSSVPAWIIGLALTVFAARVLHIYSAGIFDEWPAKVTGNWLVYLLKTLSMPMLAIFLSKIFQSIYLWRTFFLVHAGEDYVEMAKAKGLDNRLVDRRYVLRPALPSLLTSFATMITGIWQEAIILELFFGIGGIGHLFYTALRYARTEMPLLIGLTVTFAYLLALSVFILDIFYVLVDPRVRFEGQRMSARPAHRRGLRAWLSGGGSLFRRPAPALTASWQDTRPIRARRGRRAPLPAHLQDTQPLRTAPRAARPRRAPASYSQARAVFQEFRRYPSAIAGLVIILVMVGVSIYTIIAYPYRTTIALWRSGVENRVEAPKEAAPAWTNWLRAQKLPGTTVLNTADGSASKQIGETSNGVTPVKMEFPFALSGGGFPTEVILRLTSTTKEKNIFVSPTWVMPDGREFHAGNFSTRAAHEDHHLLQEDAVLHKKANDLRKFAWFSVKDTNPPAPLAGRYLLRVDAVLFEPGADIDAEVILHGQVYGLAGTDQYRRELIVPLLWGTPIALTFGLLGALLASLVTMSLAATGAWFGGWVDGIIQRLTEINMVIPAFPLLVLVYISISKNIWVILGLAVLLNMMNTAVKNYRAAFLQIKESAYIEAALSYGASDWRIIFGYLVPRILPVMVPQLVSLAPGLVFLEATLSFLNISDPTLPTWGKLIQESISGGALNGAYYQVMQPVFLLLLTGLALSMIGFALDRILNPRLREI